MSKKRILYVNWKPFLDNVLNELIDRVMLSIYIFNRNQLSYLISDVITICHCVFVNYTLKRDARNKCFIFDFGKLISQLIMLKVK